MAEDVRFLFERPRATRRNIQIFTSLESHSVLRLLLNPGHSFLGVSSSSPDKDLE